MKLPKSIIAAIAASTQKEHGGPFITAIHTCCGQVYDDGAKFGASLVLEHAEKLAKTSNKLRDAQRAYMAVRKHSDNATREEKGKAVASASINLDLALASWRKFKGEG